MAMVTLSLKVSEETQKRLKILSALSGESMGSIISGFIDQQDINMPDYLTNKKPTKKEKKERKMGNKYNPQAIKARVIALKAEGLNYQGIAKALDAEGLATSQGGNWNRATISNIWRRSQKLDTSEEKTE